MDTKVELSTEPGKGYAVLNNCKINLRSGNFYTTNIKLTNSSSISVESEASLKVRSKP